MWTDEAFRRWWKAMGQIFGRTWYDTHGPEPTELWKDSLSRLTLPRAGQIIEHYRTSGDTYPPNLSQVVNLTKTLAYPREPEPPRISRDAPTDSKVAEIAESIAEMKSGRKKTNAFLPGESLDDFLKASRESGLSREAFIEKRISEKSNA